MAQLLEIEEEIALFGRKKKRDAVKNPIHPIFGEMKHIGIEWDVAEKIELTLWNKTYEIPMSFIASTDKDGITANQEEAFKKLKDVITEQKSEMEKAIIFYTKTDDEEKILNRFIPYDILFSRNGECALFMKDTEEDGAYNDDTETAFALFLVPKIFLCASEDSLDFLLGGGGFLEDELYS